jgi:hypothetical protein
MVAEVRVVALMVAVAFVAADICPRRAPMSATAAVMIVTVTPLAVTVRVTVATAAVNGVSA